MMMRGRWPQADDEIALGSTTLGKLGLDVGDTVRQAQEAVGPGRKTHADMVRHHAA